jgi:hypothetical protein
MNFNNHARSSVIFCTNWNYFNTVLFAWLLWWSAYGVEFQRVGPVLRHLQQTRAMFVKHILHSWRNIIMTLVQIFTPVLFTILACLIVRTLPTISDPPPLNLSVRSFPSVIVPYRLRDHLNGLAWCYTDVVNEQVDYCSIWFEAWNADELQSVIKLWWMKFLLVFGVSFLVDNNTVQLPRRCTVHVHELFSLAFSLAFKLLLIVPYDVSSLCKVS